MKYVTVSENVFRDLLNEKSRVNDVKDLLAKAKRGHYTHKNFMRQLHDAVYHNRYNETEDVINGRSKVD